MYIPTIEKLPFNLSHVSILGSMECGKTRNDCFLDNASKNNLKLRIDYAEKISKATSIEIQSQHWGGNRQLSMEGISVEYFPAFVDNGNNEEKSESLSYISGDNEQYACHSHAHMVHQKQINRIGKIFFWYVNSTGGHL